MSENILADSAVANAVQTGGLLFQESHHGIKSSPNNRATFGIMPVSEDGNKPGNVSSPVDDHYSGIGQQNSPVLTPNKIFPRTCADTTKDYAKKFIRYVYS